MKAEPPPCEGKPIVARLLPFPAPPPAQRGAWRGEGCDPPSPYSLLKGTSYRASSSATGDDGHASHCGTPGSEGPPDRRWASPNCQPPASPHSISRSDAGLQLLPAREGPAGRCHLGPHLSQHSGALGLKFMSLRTLAVYTRASACTHCRGSTCARSLRAEDRPQHVSLCGRQEAHTLPTSSLWLLFLQLKKGS